MINESPISITTPSGGWNLNHKACYRSLVFNNDKITSQHLLQLLSISLERKPIEAYNLIVFELLFFWTERFVKLAAPDQALQKIGDAEILQESVYSGCIRCHGLKIILAVFLNGMIGYVYGPISGRENDIDALNMSQLNN
jgi:hypothetical protein